MFRFIGHFIALTLIEALHRGSRDASFSSINRRVFI